MKKLLLGFLAFGLLLSCDNEIDVNAEYKDITVVYGLLDPEADVNYIRVQRGYLGNEAASASYGISDSLYYDSTEIDVFLRSYLPSSEAPLNEVELIWDNSIVLDSGTYTGEGHHLYRVPSSYSIDRDKEYEVVVRRMDGSEAKARTGIVGEINILEPNQSITNRFFRGLLRFRIDQDIEEGDYEATEKMIAYQPILYLNYKELDRTTLEETFHKVTMRLPLQETPFDQFDITYDQSQFFGALSGSIEPDPTKNKLRFAQKMELRIIGVTENMMTYIELNSPATGVNQNRPQFEQVSNGAGILSSRTIVDMPNIEIVETLDDRMLSNGLICDLNFTKIRLNGSDTCYCIDNKEVCF
ncbi:MAG: hypothetical protein NXI09_15030 [Bacteroidetes bacterium]|nr:hypothetical protein [Bacteroidota bacterium]